ncbi:MAG: DoxX family protein [Anaerolineales bacterium]|nr:DoxX family protein [Anaerolineales bacterium]
MATFTGRLFGQKTTFEYSENAIGYALVGSRIVMGWILFQAGLEKVLVDNWTAADFLVHGIPDGNPFMWLWVSFAGNPVIDFLVMWGLTLTGFGLMIGALTRWNAFWGAFMMVMFWMASLSGGLAVGFPIEHGYFVDEHIVYAVLLFGLGAFGAGRIVGVDVMLEELDLVKNTPALKYFLG